MYRKQFRLLAVVLYLCNTVLAQDCSVAVAALTGQYEGGCKKGKADGMGVATGEDHYEGLFKAGLPNGKGIYTWKNGDWYDGEWQKGLRHGPGIMHFKREGEDSVLTGFWKKDQYAGLYEKPYTVHKKTVHVTDITFQVNNRTSNQVELFLNSETGGLNTSFGGTPVAKPEITDIQLITGNYIRNVVNTNYAKKISYLFENVTFPFRAIFSINFGKDLVELEIAEAGNWTVEVRTSL